MKKAGKSQNVFIVNRQNGELSQERPFNAQTGFGLSKTNQTVASNKCAFAQLTMVFSCCFVDRVFDPRQTIHQVTRNNTKNLNRFP
jgi:hypothetical protein